MSATEFLAKHRYARITARKARLAADQIRGLPVDNALNILAFSNKKGAVLVKKVLEEGIFPEGSVAVAELEAVLSEPSSSEENLECSQGDKEVKPTRESILSPRAGEEGRRLRIQTPSP